MNLPPLLLLLSAAATPADAAFCGCDSCTRDVWDALATDSGGSFTCGDRIRWLQSDRGYDEERACAKVSDEFSDGPCGPVCDPARCRPTPSLPTKSPTSPEPTVSPTALTNAPSPAPSRKPTNYPSNYPTASPSESVCGCKFCTEEVLASIAEGHSCESRIAWVMENYGSSNEDACNFVADEYPAICGLCHSGHCGTSPPPLTRGLKVVSYNTEYTGYWDGRFSNFAKHIRDIDADVVGLQECQDASAIAAESGYTLLLSGDNAILYKATRLEPLRSGSFSIPNDNYAQRTISWGEFRINQENAMGVGSAFLFFNTHLPHRHGEAADPNTHAHIAKMLLEKEEDLGGGPSIVTGDCNPFASSGAIKGSFESNLANGGIIKAYQATGNTGGYSGLDKIFASQEHWTWSNAADVGTGTSDHPAITATFELHAISPPTTPAPMENVPSAQPSAFGQAPTDNKCGGAVDASGDSKTTCETHLWSPTGDDTMHCFAYGGTGDACHMNNNNDEDDGIFKDPSLCTGDTFYLWDEPDTQGRDYSWAGSTWLDYSKRFAQELEQLRSRGAKVTGPLLKAGRSGIINQNMQTFFDACGQACLDETDPAYIDVIAVNAFCGPWNGPAGCRGGARFIYDEVMSVSSTFNDLPVYITNWSRLQTSVPIDQVEAIESIDEFFPASGVVDRVYWFGARDYGGGAETTGYLTNVLPDGRSLGEVWRTKCDSI